MGCPYDSGNHHMGIWGNFPSNIRVPCNFPCDSGLFVVRKWAQLIAIHVERTILSTQVAGLQYQRRNHLNNRNTSRKYFIGIDEPAMFTCWRYPQLTVCYGKSRCLIGKWTLSMAMSNTYDSHCQGNRTQALFNILLSFNVHRGSRPWPCRQSWCRSPLRRFHHRSAPVFQGSSGSSPPWQCPKCHFTCCFIVIPTWWNILSLRIRAHVIICICIYTYYFNVYIR